VNRANTHGERQNPLKELVAFNRDDEPGLNLMDVTPFAPRAQQEVEIGQIKKASLLRSRPQALHNKTAQ
jgi:hypothetical protein